MSDMSKLEAERQANKARHAEKIRARREHEAAAAARNRHERNMRKAAASRTREAEIIARTRAEADRQRRDRRLAVIIAAVLAVLSVAALALAWFYRKEILDVVAPPILMTVFTIFVIANWKIIILGIILNTSTKG